MALDVLGPDDIKVDGDMSRPSDPMPYKRKCSSVFAPIAFSTRKTFWKKFLGNGVTSVTSVTSIENIHRFLARLARLAHLIASKSARATLCSAKNKNPQKNL
jgi:hypothetical protein